MNPYQTPTEFPDSPIIEPQSRIPLSLRIAIGLAVSLVPFWIWGFNPAAAMTFPFVSFLTAVATAILIGLMPSGYGKFDGLMGLWIFVLTISFSLFVWQLFSPTVAPLERTSALILFLLGFGLGLGVILVGVYVTARVVSRIIIRRISRHVHNPTDISAC